MGELSWSELLRRLAEALQRGEDPEELMRIIEDRLRVATAATTVGPRYGLPDSQVELEIQGLQSDIREGRFGEVDHPQTEIVRRFRSAALEFARRVVNDPAFAAELDQGVPAERVQQAIGDLPARDQQLLYLYYVERKDLRTIAGELGVPYSTAAMSLFRIFARLRAQLHIHRRAETM